ncbi:hypothetical protein A2634_02145 [Candidatus Amesbacteria bacterium RIFCSPHIGHO2_01_FULL_48_32]|uniref:Uncharacterized protein n=1 Tax=Candidatus Amesbacteria bacterium RIFCSPLOWO2_01_FULL_48_25 TaxID=1797259 RepID=A0A1F4ZDT7_9BACT|nr:MAG: hypothetical protein A2634_02145 [Candidatus Amesbacteria bacterium RIFCSPHIGHO2_01_FULL_48_32]OGD04388.1 MAG: hypothetical protein A2989_05145 [Candidatus Amesbacteria bacterium RIFCSPLOWO2_01_FULL_48_25]HJZ06226.1 hypothetical protein [Patescibacteria group bacterium]
MAERPRIVTTTFDKSPNVHVVAVAPDNPREIYKHYAVQGITVGELLTPVKRGGIVYQLAKLIKNGQEIGEIEFRY